MQTSLISPDNTWALWAFLTGWAAISIYLEQKYTWASKISGAIIALIGAMALANFNVIPLESSVYDAVWGYVVPLAIPLLLFQANIKKIWQESRRMLAIFLLSTIGTVAGAILSFMLLKDIIPHLDKIGAMMAGSYTGGGVNFAAMSAKFEAPGDLVSATVVADNAMMALFFFVLMGIPAVNFFRKNYKTPHMEEVEKNAAGDDETQAASFWKRKEISLKDIASSIATAFTLVAVSFQLADFFAGVIPSGENANIFYDLLRGIIGDQYLMLTTLTVIAVLLAPDYFENLQGTQELGTFLIYLFFVVIGVPASIALVVTTSPLLLVFVLIIVLMNLFFSLTLGKLFRFNLEEILLASNANLGGPTTAAAMAIAKGWNRLIVPILLVGTLGYIIGNYIGTGLGAWFQTLL
ncbi:hypothetical protein AAV35_011100 [Salimicrobium jeotgali]|uniref:DUF819 domain-containing protein n=1 Tax=Salimicrobium jeotgali TaxID=1230341 RepID=K2H9I0_9BACI|nr:DUF819 family protein [Salimicrobium jeotgali]AKG05273.1 hypothetical protein AAV35_011100 [Salimicrobium jeotgali]EKE32335.1 hypothetical protein MJ3_02812 [Salimicrobium jeotgali]MBM7695690.1 putative membrane protein [Salimicrobium jeotgali]